MSRGKSHGPEVAHIWYTSLTLPRFARLVHFPSSLAMSPLKSKPGLHCFFVVDAFLAHGTIGCECGIESCGIDAAFSEFIPCFESRTNVRAISSGASIRGRRPGGLLVRFCVHYRFDGCYTTRYARPIEFEFHAIDASAGDRHSHRRMRVTVASSSL